MGRTLRQTAAIKRWVDQITEALARYDHVSPDSIKLRLLPEQQKFQLMNWKSWCLRYAVNLDFILHTLLGYYEKVRRTGTGFFGVPVANLVGQRAQEIVEREVTVTFPAGECYAVRDSDIRSRLLNHRLKKFSDAGPDWESNIEQYRKRVRKVHELDAKLPAQFTRPWRTNPFVKGVR